MAKFNVVALISGGKDSLFSMLHCLANGHDIVALANLHPPESEGNDHDDLDSYMYQTVGHSIVPLYEVALGLPLFRQEIRGSAVTTQKSYRPESQSRPHVEDETESLSTLLRAVMEAHPRVNAVSTGAILSDYQRTRVESVAIRLGLTPLSYLWQFPNLASQSPASLLEDMALVGQDARIIKVASGSLDETFLWQNVADPRTVSRLVKASQRFGTFGDGAVLGEGGEYETLALGGPAPLWKGRIVVDDEALQTKTGEAGSATVRIANARVESGVMDQSTTDLRLPPLFESTFQVLFEQLQSSRWLPGDDMVEEFESSSDSRPLPAGTLLVAGVTGPGSDAAEQVSSILDTIQHKLHGAGHTLADVVYTSIVLRDIDDFFAINAAYCKSFQRPNPPARMTLACADVLPAGSRVMVSVTSTQMPAFQLVDGLHVQSVSYWAPANIGPYSQAISVPMSVDQDQPPSALVYFAGQIPLIPASMELDVPPPADVQDIGFLHQAVLSLQHLYRIADVMSVKEWVHAIALIAAPSDEVARFRAATCRRVWAGVSAATAKQASPGEDQAEDFDVWHRRYGHARWDTVRQGTIGSSFPDPNHLRQSRVPALSVIRVDALPRRTTIEWVAFGSPLGRGSMDVPHHRHVIETFAHRRM